MMTRMLFTLLCAGSLAACAATVERSEPPSAPASAGSSARAAAAVVAPSSLSRVMVLLTPAPGIAQDENWTAFREEWQTSLANAAGQHGITTALLDREPASLAQGEVLARVRVNDYRYVSQARRIGLGVMSGNARMDLSVDYLGAGKQSLGNRQFQTSSRAMQGIFSAMTPRQVAAVVEEMMAELKPR